MKLSDDYVRGIASEARLSLTEDELGGAVRFINNFLDMADRFKELDLTNVEPFCFIESRECPLREDNPESFNRIPEIFAACAVEINASDDMGPLFKVPRIMEE